MISNGQHIDTKAQLREQRAANRLLREQIQGAALKRAHARTVENYSYVQAYIDVLKARTDNGKWVPMTANTTQRQRGANYPLFTTEQELSALRTPSRIMAQTNSYAIGLIEGLTSYVVGQGFAFRAVCDDQPIADAVQGVIDRHLEYNSWAGGEQPGLEEELFQRSVYDGEFFICRTANSDGTVDLRTIEPEQVTAPQNYQSEYEYSFGIGTDPRDVQKPLAYWVQWGDSPADGEEYEPGDITHFRRNVTRSVKRGLPDLCHDTYDSLALASGLRGNMGDAAQQQAAIVGVRDHGPDASRDQVVDFVNEMGDETYTANGFGRTENIINYGRAQWQDMGRGLKYAEGPLASNGTVHLAVLQSLCRAACTRWNAPEWLGSADASNNNFACHDSETELLTKRGWVRYGDIQPDDFAGTMNAKSGRFEWQQLQAIHVHDYDGEMVRLASRDTDMLVTPNHRMYTARHRSERRKEWGGKIRRVGVTAFGFKRADELCIGDVLPLSCKPATGMPIEGVDIPGVQHKRKYLNESSHPQTKFMPMTPLLSFLGWFVSEGWTVSRKDYSRGHCIGISQNTKAVVECENIRVATKGLAGLNVNEFHQKNGLTKWQINDKSLWSWLRTHCGVGSYSKKLPEFVFDLPAEQTKPMLEALLLGDGSHHGNGSAHYFTVSKKLADQVQTISLMCGHVCNIEKPMRNGVMPVSVRRSDRVIKVGKNHLGRQHYIGKVWCVTVPNGLIITRRNGKAIVSGNSSLTAESPFIKTVLRRQKPMANLYKREIEFAVEHYISIHGLTVRGEQGTVRTLTWDDVKQLVTIQVEPPSPETRDKLLDAQRRQIEKMNNVLSGTTWQQQIGLDPEIEAKNFTVEQERNPNAGQPLAMPPEMGANK